MTLEWRMDHKKGEALESVVGMKDVDVLYVMLNGWGGRIELLHGLCKRRPCHYSILIILFNNAEKRNFEPL